MNLKTYFKLQSWVRKSLFFKSISSVLSYRLNYILNLGPQKAQRNCKLLRLWTDRRGLLPSQLRENSYCRDRSVRPQWALPWTTETAWRGEVGQGGGGLQLIWRESARTAGTAQPRVDRKAVITMFNKWPSLTSQGGGCLKVSGVALTLVHSTKQQVKTAELESNGPDRRV